MRCSTQQWHRGRSTLWLLGVMILAGCARSSPAANGVDAPRNWTEPFTALPAAGAYVSVIQREGRYEMWHIVWRGMNADETQAAQNLLVVYRGNALETLGPEETVEDLRPLITDVMDPAHAEQLAPWRAMTRPAMLYEPDVGYVLQGCVVAAYKPGSLPLLPALFTSPTGLPGTWKYLGILAPEPKELGLRNTVWCDGGGIVHLGDGRWRIYLNNYVKGGLSVVEADSLRGPWKFLRNADGSLRDVLAGQGGAFPSVLRVAEHEWHLWVSIGWPPTEIRHYWSTDGLRWQPYGPQPEITPHSVGDRVIKCVRAHVEGGRIVGLLSIINDDADPENPWISYRSSMPLGPPKK